MEIGKHIPRLGAYMQRKWAADILFGGGSGLTHRRRWLFGCTGLDRGGRSRRYHARGAERQSLLESSAGGAGRGPAQSAYIWSYLHAPASDSIHHYLWCIVMSGRLEAELRDVPCSTAIGQLGLQWIPRRDERQTTQHLGRLNGFEEFCALTVAGDVFHKTPLQTDAAQLRALIHDAQARRVSD